MSNNNKKDSLEVNFRDNEKIIFFFLRIDNNEVWNDSSRRIVWNLFKFKNELCCAHCTMHINGEKCFTSFLRRAFSNKLMRWILFAPKHEPNARRTIEIVRHTKYDTCNF